MTNEYWIEINEDNLKRLASTGFSDYKTLKEFVVLNGFDEMCNVRAEDPAATIRTGEHKASFIIGMDGMEFDHPCYFRNSKDGRICLTYNPYGLLFEVRRKAEAWAGQNGLKAKVSNQSWYYPQRTVFAVIYRPGENVWVKK